MKRIDLTGKKINMLTVLEKIPREENRRTQYKVKCDCGVIKCVDGSKLRNETVKSCGCFKYSEQGRKNQGIKSRKKFGESLKNIVKWSYKNNAIRKGYSFELTDDEMEFFFKCNCFYCGRPPYKTIAKSKHYGSFTYTGVDRLNNDIGYITENTVACCTDCNYLKNSYNFNEFINHIRLIYENTKNIKIENITDTNNQIHKKI